MFYDYFNIARRFWPKNGFDCDWEKVRDKNSVAFAYLSCS